MKHLIYEIKNLPLKDMFIFATFFVPFLFGDGKNHLCFTKYRV